jgi:hypothetical protein
VALTYQEVVERNQQELAPFMESTGRLSKQGKLLKLICTPPSEEIQLTALCEYSGYRRGAGALTALILEMNRDFSRTQVNQSLISRVQAIFFVLGSADTPKTHELLVSFLSPSVHPYFRAEAVCGLGLERQCYDQNLVMKLIATFDHWQDITAAIMGLTYAAWHAEPESYRATIFPFLSHTDHNVRMYAKNALDELEQRLADEADSKLTPGTHEQK